MDERGSDVTDKPNNAALSQIGTRGRALKNSCKHSEISESEDDPARATQDRTRPVLPDLLRRRHALRETGGDCRDAAVRPADEVEGYLG